MVWGLAHAAGDWWPFRFKPPIISFELSSGPTPTQECILAIFGSNGDMYTESVDLHVAGFLPQCLSLGSLDRYSLCGVVCACVL